MGFKGPEVTRSPCHDAPNEGDKAQNLEKQLISYKNINNFKTLITVLHILKKFKTWMAYIPLQILLIIKINGLTSDKKIFLQDFFVLFIEIKFSVLGTHYSLPFSDW